MNEIVTEEPSRWQALRWLLFGKKPELKVRIIEARGEGPIRFECLHATGPKNMKLYLVAQIDTRSEVPRIYNVGLFTARASDLTNLSFTFNVDLARMESDTFEHAEQSFREIAASCMYDRWLGWAFRMAGLKGMTNVHGS